MTDRSAAWTGAGSSATPRSRARPGAGLAGARSGTVRPPDPGDTQVGPDERLDGDRVQGGAELPERATDEPEVDAAHDGEPVIARSAGTGSRGAAARRSAGSGGSGAKPASASSPTTGLRARRRRHPGDRSRPRPDPSARPPPRRSPPGPAGRPTSLGEDAGEQAVRDPRARGRRRSGARVGRAPRDRPGSRAPGRPLEAPELVRGPSSGGGPGRPPARPRRAAPPADRSAASRARRVGSARIAGSGAVGHACILHGMHRTFQVPRPQPPDHRSHR